MFSMAMYTMESATSVSTSGGNHSASGARPKADAIRVIEWATVKAVTTGTRLRKRRSGSTRQRMKSRWSSPERMWMKPSSGETQKGLMPARVQPHQPWVAVEGERPHAAVRGQKAQHAVRVRSPRCAHAGRIENRESAERMGYSISTSSSHCSGTRLRSAASADR